MTAIYAHRGNAAWAGGPAPAGAGALAADPGGLHLPGTGSRSTPSPDPGVVRENTLRAFRAARRAGADGVELDVRLSADSVPVIHHDRRLPDGRDVTNIPLRLLPHDVPTLDQALQALEGMLVNVEVKHEEGQRRAAALVAEHLGGLCAGAGRTGTDPGGLPALLVSSFDEASLTLIHESAPLVPLGLLIDWHTPPASGLERAAALGCATLHPFVSQVDAGLVEAAGRAGLGLHVWTVNADADIAAMADLGVAAVITDRAAAAVALLRNGDGVPG